MAVADNVIQFPGPRRTHTSHKRFYWSMAAIVSLGFWALIIQAGRAVHIHTPDFGEVIEQGLGDLSYTHTPGKI